MKWNYGDRDRKHYDIDLKDELERSMVLPFLELDELNEYQVDLIHYAFRTFPELEKKYGERMKGKKRKWTGS